MSCARSSTPGILAVRLDPVNTEVRCNILPCTMSQNQMYKCKHLYHSGMSLVLCCAVHGKWSTVQFRDNPFMVVHYVYWKMVAYQNVMVVILHRNEPETGTGNGTGTTGNNGSTPLSQTSVNIYTWYYTFHLVPVLVPVLLFREMWLNHYTPGISQFHVYLTAYFSHCLSVIVLPEQMVLVSYDSVRRIPPHCRQTLQAHYTASC